MGVSTSGLWMRWVRFTALRDLLALLAKTTSGLSTAEMEAHLKDEPFFASPHGKPPSRTTVYHWRNTLLQLGLIARRSGRFVPNPENPLLQELLAALRPGTPDLSPKERLLFSRLVVGNEDCRRAFFDLFMPASGPYAFEHFLRDGQRVAWKSCSEVGNRRVLLYNLDDGAKRVWLQTEAELKAVLYGVRYWARNELAFLDEVFLEDLGGVMFPVEAEGPVPEPRVVSALAESIDLRSDWTVFSVRDAVLRWAPQLRLPLSRFFATLSALKRAYPEFVVMIPTSAAFATVTARTPSGEAYQLRSYLEEAGRYISHVRLHRRLREVLEWEMASRAWG